MQPWDSGQAALATRWVAVEAPAARDWARLSVSGDIQDPPGQGPVQLAVGDPASVIL